VTLGNIFSGSVFTGLALYSTFRAPVVPAVDAGDKIAGVTLDLAR
jgi:hypothetical protein